MDALPRAFMFPNFTDVWGPISHTPVVDFQAKFYPDHGNVAYVKRKTSKSISD